MPAIRKNPDKPTNKQIGLRIYADDTEIKGKEYWKELAKVFAMLCSKWTEKQLQLMLANHPLGAKVIEVLPDEA